jgi:hypothetical protein
MICDHSHFVYNLKSYVSVRSIFSLSRFVNDAIFNLSVFLAGNLPTLYLFLRMQLLPPKILNAWLVN